MRDPRIHVDLVLQPGQRVRLPASAAHHVSKVLRKRTGQRITLFNGLGGCYPAEIVTMGRQQVEVTLLAFREERRESSLQITLAQAVSRSRHMDYTLQKAVELGVSRIVPLLSEYAGMHVEEQRAEKKLRHWEKIVVHACEQCGRNLVPGLSLPVPLADWLQADCSEMKLLLHPDAGEGISGIEFIAGPLSILAGAEGGFSAQEVKSAISSGYQALALGPRVLRTETAALAAISICQSRWGDMG